MVCCVVRGRAKGRTGSGREIQAGAGQVLPGGSPLHRLEGGKDGATKALGGMSIQGSSPRCAKALGQELASDVQGTSRRLAWLGQG